MFVSILGKEIFAGFSQEFWCVKRICSDVEIRTLSSLAQIPEQCFARIGMTVDNHGFPKGFQLMIHRFVKLLMVLPVVVSQHFFPEFRSDGSKCFPVIGFS